MSSTNNRIAGLQANKRLFYKAVMEEFNKHNSQDIPIAVIHRKHIYPKFFISRQTLYNIFKQEV